MNLSPVGIKLLQDFESLRLTAYLDPGSADGRPITIGWGTTYYEDNSPIKRGDVITRERADSLLAMHVREAEEKVRSLVTAPLTQGQFDALVSFQYNTGDLARSTLLKRLNAGDVDGTATEFDRWIFNDGKEMRGLVNRRKAERNFFESKVPVTPIPQQGAAKVDPFILPAITVLAQLIPTISKLFKGEAPSRVAERNMEAVEAIANKVIPIVVNAAGAPNVQAAVDSIRNDPAMVAAVDSAVRMNYAELHELAEKSFAAARQFNIEIATAGIKPWEMPAMWVTLLAFTLVAYVVVRVMHIPFAEGKDLVILTVTAIVGALSTVLGFWLGSSRDSQRKTEIMAEK